jgi:hypothetical protein
MRRYPLRRSIHNLLVSDAQAAVTGRPTARRSSGGDRRCPRGRRGTARFGSLPPAVGWDWRSPVPLVDRVDEPEIEPAADPFLQVPWWTLGRATSGAKREMSPPAPAPTSSGEGDGNHDLATILRRALMDLAAALQEIERQLTAIPGNRAAPTRR